MRMHAACGHESAGWKVRQTARCDTLRGVAVIRARRQNPPRVKSLGDSGCKKADDMCLIECSGEQSVQQHRESHLEHACRAGQCQLVHLIETVIAKYCVGGRRGLAAHRAISCHYAQS